MSLEPGKGALHPVLGMSLGEAKFWCESNKEVFRVAKRDGVPCVLTRDYIPHRINLVVQEGFVKEVYFG